MKCIKTFALIILMISYGNINGQILKKFKDKVQEKIEQKTDQKVDEAAQKTVDTPEEILKKKNNNSDNKTNASNNKQINNSVTQSKKPDIDYGSFDFIPGDSILFEDEFINERINEIPSLWVPQGGKLEIVKTEDKTVMGFLGENTYAYPRMKKYNYLPKRFTIEFDFMSKHNSGKTTQQAFSDGNGTGEAKVYFYTDEKDRNRGVLKDFDNVLSILTEGKMEFKSFSATFKKGGNDGYELPEELCDKWIHISIAVTETNMKVYMNSKRILNVPVEGKASSLTLGATGTDYEMGFKTFIRNVRIAGGLKDPYKQGTSEIKKSFIARGIKFDYNQATIKPESMGELNNVVAMLKDHPETKYEIGGHTDSDGDDSYNLKLSQQRADAVKNKLVEMGIDASRLTTKGYGKIKPIATNTTPDGKANNRRVEFVLTK